MVFNTRIGKKIAEFQAWDDKKYEIEYMKEWGRSRNK